MKLLNLANLNVATNRRVKIGEKEHDVVPLKVSDFLYVTEQAEQLAKEAEAGGVTAAKEVRLIIDFILRVIPTASKEEVDALSLEDLHRINNFVRGLDVDGITEVVEGESDEGK